MNNKRYPLVCNLLYLVPVPYTCSCLEELAYFSAASWNQLGFGSHQVIHITNRCTHHIYTQVQIKFILIIEHHIYTLVHIKFLNRHMQQVSSLWLQVSSLSCDIRIQNTTINWHGIWYIIEVALWVDDLLKDGPGDAVWVHS